jgi:hypothetical protein
MQDDYFLVYSAVFMKNWQVFADYLNEFDSSWK